MTYDLIVIGGGPGGCATAITAARAGASVLLLERGHYPRHRVCGEFVSAESLLLLSELLSDGNRQLIAGAPRISQSRVFTDGSILRLPIEPSAASILRYDLDRALWQSCIDAKVHARQGCAVRSLRGEGPYAVETDSGVFHSGALVNAAGRWSFLSSPRTRSRANSERWVGVKGHFREPQPSQTVDLYFFRGGYCGVQPVAIATDNASDGVVNVCAMVRAEVAAKLEDVFPLHRDLQLRSGSWLNVTQPVSTSPLVFHKPEPLQGSVLQVGDAATFVDPFIGDGISLALRSGALAAECLQPFFKGAGSLQQACTEYERIYMRRLARVFEASSLLRRLLRVPALIRRPAMSLLRHTPAITRQIVRMTR